MASARTIAAQVEGLGGQLGAFAGCYLITIEDAPRPIRVRLLTLFHLNMYHILN